MATDTRTAPDRRWVLALASVASFMISLDSLVVTTALTRIRLDLGASIEALEWTVNAYNLSFAALLMTGAALGDRLGRKRVFIAGLGLFTAASVACALSPDVDWLIGARAVQGAGAALVLPLALTQLSAAFPPHQRGRAIGIFTGVAGLATFSGPFVGGAVAEGLDWEWIFWINLPIGVAVVLLAARRLRDSVGPDNRLDPVGVVLATAGALGLVWGLVRGGSAGWSSPEVAGSLVAGALLVVAFGAWEQRARAPMLPMRFFRIRAFATANAANFFLFASLYLLLFLLAQFLQTAQSHGPLAAGLRLMPWTGTLMVLAPIAGALADRFGERRFLVGGLLLQAIGMGWLALIAAPDLPYLQLLIPGIIAGCGLSMAMPTVQRAAVGAVASQEIGKASGAINTLRIFGGVFGIAIGVAVFAAHGSYASPQAFTDGFVPAIVVVAALGLAGAIAGLGVPGRGATRIATPVPPVPVPALPPQREAAT